MKNLFVLFLLFTLMTSWSVFFASQNVEADYRNSGSTWYLRDHTANSEFDTTGPSMEYSVAGDLVSNSPNTKTTAYAMTNDPGTSQSSVVATETLNTAGNIWLRTYLSPKLSNQSLPSGTTFRFEAGLAESSTSANIIYRMHVYLWRQGTGYVSSLVDAVPATGCGVEPGASNSNRSQVCISSATVSSLSIEDGDQIALELWVNANNTSTTSFNATHYLNGTGFVGNGTASHAITSSMSSFSVSKTLELQSDSANNTVWYFRDQTAGSQFGTAGPNAEYSSASDLASSSPSGKTIAYAMTHSQGTSQSSIIATETSSTAGNIWLRTFLSPQLTSQTINTGTIFRFESGLAENSTSANMTYRIHIYLWRQGTGYVRSFFDGVAATACGAEPGAANSNRSEVCLTTATGSSVTVNDGDQIALEVWANANNSSTTSFNVTSYFNGTGFIENGAASHTLTSALSSLSISSNVLLLATGMKNVDMVDEFGVSLRAPSIRLSPTSFSFDTTSSSGVLGDTNEKIRISNSTGVGAWTLSIAATSGGSAKWSSGADFYDYNDSSLGGADDIDSDSYGGQLTLDPSIGDLSAISPCDSVSGLSKGSPSSFRDVPPSVNSITVLSADNTASGNCSWDFMGIGLNQTIPGNQAGGTYNLSLTLSLL